MKVRKAKPDDKGHIAKMIYSSGSDLYDYIYQVYGKTAEDFIAYEFKSGRGFAGYNNVTVIANGDEVLGTGCFYSGKDYGRLSLGTLKNTFRFYGFFKALTIMLRMHHIGSVMKKPKDDELYLSNLGVDTSCRGTGLGRHFMVEKIDQAKQDGYRMVSLDVSVNNPRAEKLYATLGFDVINIKHFSDKKADIGSAKKMEMLLNESA